MLAVQCYKGELEAAFKSERISGFQLLDLQDYHGQGGAFVGILDAFMDSKGLVSPDKWRGFCSDCVVVADFEKFNYVCNEKFTAELSAVWYKNFIPKDSNKNGHSIMVTV